MKWKLTAALLIIPVFFFLSGISPALADTVGYTSIGASEYAVGTSGTCNNPGLLITIPSAGSMTKITAHVKNSTGSANGTASLYAGSAGSRGALIATTNSASITTSYAWVDFTFASAQSVSATTYWLQFNGQCSNGPGGNLSIIKYDTGGGANTSYFLNDSGTPIYGTDQYSIYATYTPDSAPATTPVSSRVNINNGSIKVNNGSIIVKPN